MNVPSDLEAYRLMLDLLCLDSYYFSVAKEEDGSFVLLANVNDVFCPAADAETIPPHCLAEVLEVYLSSANPDEPYSAVVEWIGKRRGLVPNEWRKS